MIDIGLNLFNAQFDADRSDVLVRAQKTGVNGCILTCTSLEIIPKTLAFVHGLPNFLSMTAGVHPHASQRTLLGQDSALMLDLLATAMASSLVVAVGETGLDYEHEYSPRHIQQELFTWHLHQACLLNKPLFLHERGAHADFVRLIRSAGLPSRPGVVHCFTGNAEEAKRYLDFGLYLGVTGWLTDSRRNTSLLDALRFVPHDRVLIETDAPFLTPRTQPKLPRRNEPQYLRTVASALANVWGKPFDYVSDLTQYNTEILFQRRWTHGNV